MDPNVSFFSNPNLLPWLVPVGPLLSFFIITLLTNRAKMVPGTSPEYADHNHPSYLGINVGVASRASRIATIIVGLGSILIAWLIALSVVGSAFAVHNLGEEVLGSNIDWMATGTTTFKLGVMVDPLTTIMLTQNMTLSAQIGSPFDHCQGLVVTVTVRPSEDHSGAYARLRS